METEPITQSEAIVQTVLDDFEGRFEGDVTRMDRGLPRVEDVDGDIASPTVHSEIHHEYVHLVRTADGWKIANALWRRS